MLMGKGMTRLADFNTRLHADSVEWCPTLGLEGILSCGTYQLNERESIREGSVLLFKWDDEKLTKILDKETDNITSGAGVLDMKWKTTSENTPVLAVAVATGSVQFIRLDQDPDLTVKKIGKEEISSGGLCLSLDWSSCDSSVAVSDSFGQVGVVEVSPTGPRLSKLWKAHDYESWITCFGYDRHIVFSGGDDCKFHCWDLRSHTHKSSSTCKWHTMGVCSLQIHPTDKNILVSGSYDEHLVLWDVRNLSKPLKDCNLGGGVWRVKWNPHLTNYVAVACMHNHFGLVHAHVTSSDPMEVLQRYEGHTSLAYGIDWCSKASVDEKEQKHQFTLASCSFYDNSMHLWTTAIKTSNDN